MFDEEGSWHPVRPSTSSFVARPSNSLRPLHREGPTLIHERVGGWGVWEDGDGGVRRIGRDRVMREVETCVWGRPKVNV